MGHVSRYQHVEWERIMRQCATIKQYHTGLAAEQDKGLA